MNIFEKGDYRPVPDSFRMKGIYALQELTKFQEEFESYDTDTTINEIRDCIVGNYLGYDLLNFNKHGFDCKSSKTGKYLEVKQCSVFSKRIGGTWNDTNEEKAMAFSDNRLFTAVGVWKGATDLQFIVYGQHEDLGAYLLDRVKAVANTSTRSTQNIGIEKMIKDYNFIVICPPSKTKEFVYELLLGYKIGLAKVVTKDDVREISDL